MHTCSADLQTHLGTLKRVDSRLGLIGLFLHDFHDHATGGRAALGGGVDGDGLFCGACVLFSMDVHPGRQKQTQGVDYL